MGPALLLGLRPRVLVLHPADSELYEPSKGLLQALVPGTHLSGPQVPEGENGAFNQVDLLAGGAAPCVRVTGEAWKRGGQRAWHVGCRFFRGEARSSPWVSGGKHTSPERPVTRIDGAAGGGHGITPACGRQGSVDDRPPTGAGPVVSRCLALALLNSCSHCPAQGAELRRAVSDIGSALQGDELLLTGAATARPGPITLLTAAEAAELLRVPKGSIEAWVSTGRVDIPHLKLSSRTTRYPKEALLEWVAARRRLAREAFRRRAEQGKDQP